MSASGSRKSQLKRRGWRKSVIRSGTKDLTESERRQRIYAVERLRRLDDERVEALALRRSYLDDA